MAIVVQSRFACLNPVDDDYRPKKTSIEKKNGNVEKENKSKKSSNNKPTKNKAANGKNNKGANDKVIPSSSSNKSQGKKKKEATAQWEQWKEKDMTLVDHAYEAELQHALLLSKLDYEKEKQNHSQSVNETEKETKKSKKKNVPMSLEKFQDHCSKEASEPKKSSTNSKTDIIESDSQFFEKMENEVQIEISREQKKKPDSRKTHDNAVTILQFQRELEKQRLENEDLKKELEKARREILVQKMRNKKLASLIGHGDIKDKAEALLEVERLSREQTELTAEVARLYGLLEQERSKVGALTHDFKHKDKIKKRNASESSGHTSK